MNETPYNLPPGVEPGYILKAGNPLPVGWEGQTSSARGGWLETSFPNEGIPWDPHKDRLVRPTAANPLQPLPPHTFPLPDGTLACFRRDAAKLREAGAVLRFPGVTLKAHPTNDDRYPGDVLMVEFPAPPKTERVPWHAAKGRLLPDSAGRPVLRVGMSDRFPLGAVSIGADGSGIGWFPADAFGRVEVLATDGAL